MGPDHPTTGFDDIRTVLCDLDGVIWLAHRPIPGSVDAVAALRSSGRRVLFVTNNSAATQREHEAALHDIGISAHGDVVSSSMAAATLVEPGERVLVVGGAGIAEAVEARGAVVYDNDGDDPDAVDAVDAVVVGLHTEFDYARLSRAATAVRRGARLVGTNDDATFPTPNGLRPGGGAILAAVATASGTEPIIGGKPHQPMATLISDMLSDEDSSLDLDSVAMVGDRPETDGRFADRLGCRFILVRSGVTGRGEHVEGPVALDVDDLAVAAAVLGAGADAAG